jgi:2-amino-4-hydroxy-6-hydroxymethyldihydropteridine diphosphokinase
LKSPQSESVLFGLGSNVGDRREHLAQAIDMLKKVDGMALVGVSRLYEGPAWGGPPGQRDHLNAVAHFFATSVQPTRLLDRILAFELERGRTRSVKNGPRTLDIDILLFGERVIDEPTLTIPHPGMAERPFVLLPAQDIAGDHFHPLTGKTIADLARACRFASGLRVVEEFGWHDVARSVENR